MHKQLIIGSHNRDKSAELAVLLRNTAWLVKSLSELDPVEEPIEDQETFEGNALLKARHYGDLFHVPCVADDSGLEVDALGGKPGVYSARYAGDGCSYEDNNIKLLRALVSLPENERSARFVCCAAYVDPEGHEQVERGVVEGKIAKTMRGDNGFGYDPVFIPNGHDQTFGELAPMVKREISHRAQAFGRLREYLASLR